MIGQNILVGLVVFAATYFLFLRKLLGWGLHALSIRLLRRGQVKLAFRFERLAKRFKGAPGICRDCS